MKNGIAISLALIIVASGSIVFAAEKSKAPSSQLSGGTTKPPVVSGLCADPAVVSLQALGKSIQNGEAVFTLTGKLCNNGTLDYDNANDPIAFKFAYSIFGYLNHAPVTTQSFTAGTYQKLAKGQCVSLNYTLKAPKISALGETAKNPNVKILIEALAANGANVPSSELFYNNRKKNCLNTNDSAHLPEIPAFMTK